MPNRVQSRSRGEDRLPRNVGLWNDLEAVGGKMAVEDFRKPLHVARIRTHDGMDHFAKEGQKVLIRATQKIEA